MSWLTEGPIQALLHRGSDQTATGGGGRTQGPIQSFLSRMGDGPVTALTNWMGSRGLGDMANRNAGTLPQLGFNGDVNLGDPQSSAERMGPPADLAGNYSMDPNATEMGPPADDAGRPRTHQEIRDDLDAELNNRAGNYGVSNFMVGGAPVIFGSRGNDMNQVAMIRRTPGN